MRTVGIWHVTKRRRQLNLQVGVIAPVDYRRLHRLTIYMRRYMKPKGGIGKWCVFMVNGRLATF